MVHNEMGRLPSFYQLFRNTKLVFFEKKVHQFFKKFHRTFSAQVLKVIDNVRKDYGSIVQN